MRKPFFSTLLFVLMNTLFIQNTFAEENQNPFQDYLKTMQKFFKEISAKNCDGAERTLGDVIKLATNVTSYRENRIKKMQAKNNQGGTAPDLREFRQNTLKRQINSYRGMLKRCRNRKSGVRSQRDFKNEIPSIRMSIPKERRALMKNGLKLSKLLTAGKCDEAKPVIKNLTRKLVERAVVNIRQYSSGYNLDSKVVRKQAYESLRKVYARLMARCYAKKSGKKTPVATAAKIKTPVNSSNTVLKQEVTTKNGCLTHSAKWDGVVLSVTVKNTCSTPVNANICMNIPKHAPFAVERKSKKLSSNSTHSFEFISVEEPVYKYKTRWCKAGKSARCLAKCP